MIYATLNQTMSTQDISVLVAYPGFLSKADHCLSYSLSVKCNLPIKQYFATISD